MPLQFLIGRAFNGNNGEQLVGMPAFASTERYDITATTSSGGPALGPLDMDLVAPMVLNLLKDRFKLAYHTEERPVTAYSLVAAKPKMKKADPNSRIFCKNINAPAGAPPGARSLQCQNASMELFAERLRNLTPDLNGPIEDQTALEGGWDFTLTFVFRPSLPMPPARGGDPNAAPGAIADASDPAGGYTIFEAIEKQLGVLLEKQKRPMPVIVIDHLEQKPTEN